MGNSSNNFFVGGAGRDIIHGFGGSDTISFADMKTGYTVALENTALGTIKGYSIANNVRGVEDYIYTIENIIGTNYNDTIRGNTEANVLCGGKGNDLLTGYGGGDTYWFSKSNTEGFGNDKIIHASPNAEGDGDRIWFDGNALDKEDLWFSRVGNTLVIEFIGSDDSVRVEDWYSGSGARIDEIVINQAIKLDTAGVEQLVTAMASVLSSYGGDVTGSDYGGVNPNLDNTQLATLAASLWH